MTGPGAGPETSPGGVADENGASLAATACSCGDGGEAGGDVAACLYDPSRLIPEDPNLAHGTLDNGLEYFVRPNAKPKQQATAWLVVKVGSLAETEAERGMAHFVEHLAFRGTKTFGHGALVEFFEKAGIAFGHHLNAHTGLNETVYKLQLPLSADGARHRSCGTPETQSRRWNFKRNL